VVCALTVQSCTSVPPKLWQPYFLVCVPQVLRFPHLTHRLLGSSSVWLCGFYSLVHWLSSAPVSPLSPSSVRCPFGLCFFTPHSYSQGSYSHLCWCRLCILTQLSAFLGPPVGLIRFCLLPAPSDDTPLLPHQVKDQCLKLSDVPGLCGFACWTLLLFPSWNTA
jgi:hypothetical protein